MRKPRNKRVIIYRGDSFYIAQVTKPNFNHYYEVWRLWDGVYRRKFKAKIYFDEKMFVDLFKMIGNSFTASEKTIVAIGEMCACLNKGDMAEWLDLGEVKAIQITSTAELNSWLKSHIYTWEYRKGLENNINDACPQSDN